MLISFILCKHLLQIICSRMFPISSISITPCSHHCYPCDEPSLCVIYAKSWCMALEYNARFMSSLRSHIFVMRWRRKLGKKPSYFYQMINNYFVFYIHHNEMPSTKRCTWCFCNNISSDLWNEHKQGCWHNFQVIQIGVRGKCVCTSQW